MGDEIVAGSGEAEGAYRVCVVDVQRLVRGDGDVTERGGDGRGDTPFGQCEVRQVHGALVDCDLF